MTLTRMLKDNLLLLVLLVLIGGAGLYFFVIHPKLRVSGAPEFIDARVVLKTNRVDYATDEFMVVTPDDEPELQAVVIARKSGDTEPTYFSLSPMLKLDGEFVPEDRIELWDTFKWKEVRFLWSKIEPRVKPRLQDEPFAYESLEYKYQFQMDWPLEWTHVLDVTGFLNSYPRQNYGVMRFKVRAEIKTSMVDVVQKAESAGETDIGDGNILSEDVYMIQMAPSRELFGYAVSLFNLAYAREVDWDTFAGEKSPVTRRLAIDQIAYFTEAARMAGFEDIPQGDVDALKARIVPVLENVRLDTEKNVYVDGNGTPVRTEQLKKGMFLVQGDKLAMYAGEGSFEVGKLHVFSPDDRVLYAPDLPLYYEHAGNHFERPFMIGELR